LWKNVVVGDDVGDDGRGEGVGGGGDDNDDDSSSNSVLFYCILNPLFLLFSHSGAFYNCLL
jgi:hypothetical protein